MDKSLFFQIALTLVPGIGSINAKSLIAYCGSAEAVFKEKKTTLLKIPGIGEQTATSLNYSHEAQSRAEKEIRFMTNRNIRPLFFTDPQYPIRLKQCPDSPVLLFYKGSADLNNLKVLGIVGTRNVTAYGKECCKKLIEELTSDQLLVVSGLAYGVDAQAHKCSLENGLETVGVLGHGLDMLYPSQHQSLAERMLQQGGLLTEYISETKPDAVNFPRRNRIIAGMCDALVVIEAGSSGGALITANLANSYNRDVFAVPGRVGDAMSTGCNNLIRTNVANLITSADDIRYFLNWDKKTKKPGKMQRDLFATFSPEEQGILDILKKRPETDIDTLTLESNLLPSKVAAVLLNLEFERAIQCLPGKVYKLNG